MHLIYFLNINIFVLNIDILPEILNNDILSSYWKRRSIKFYTCLVQENYKIFILFSYPDRGNETNGGWVAVVGCVGWCRAAGQGPHDLFGGVRCTIKILMGGGRGG